MTAADLARLNKRKLNPRVCRGCGAVFMPTTALQRYGRPDCKESHVGNFRCRAVPGAKVTHR